MRAQLICILAQKTTDTLDITYPGRYRRYGYAKRSQKLWKLFTELRSNWSRIVAVFAFWMDSERPQCKKQPCEGSQFSIWQHSISLIPREKLIKQFVFDCARRARLIWEHLGLEESDLLTDIRIRIKQDQKLIKELRDIAGKDKNIDSTKVTDPDLDLMIDEYIGIIFNTGMNAERYPEIAKLDPLINNGPHMTAGATDAKLIGNNGKLLASQTPFDYPIPHLSSELVLESEQGIRQLREAAKRDPWLQEHYRKQDMDPYNITDKDIALMRMYQRFQTHIIMAAGGIPYLEGENWHVDWPENPRDPRTGRLLQDRSQFLRTNGWDSGNPSFVTEKYAPGKYATKNRPHKGVKAVFGGNDAFRKARKLGIIE